jgi:hypothetical protein
MQETLRKQNAAENAAINIYVVNPKTQEADLINAG